MFRVLLSLFPLQCGLKKSVHMYVDLVVPPSDSNRWKAEGQLGSLQPAGQDSKHIG